MTNVLSSSTLTERTGPVGPSGSVGPRGRGKPAHQPDGPVSPVPDGPTDDQLRCPNPAHLPSNSDLWTRIRGTAPSDSAPLALSPSALEYRRLIRDHKAWLATFPHECPSPYPHYRIGVYIRYFNQTKYENYLDYHKQEFADTIALCPNWTLVDFYIDEGQTAPNMESCPGWTRLLEDCFAGKVDLIVTQKTTNVSRKPRDLALISRVLASQPNPVGIYFISEDLFTLASYYQADLHERGFLPDNWSLLPDEEQELPFLEGGNDVAEADDE